MTQSVCRRFAALGLAVLLATGGCATGGGPGGTTTGDGSGAGGPIAIDLAKGVCPPPPRPGEIFAESADGEGAEEDGLKRLIAVDDPIEPVNRSIYAFNYLFDRYVFLPVVDTYTFVVPEVLRDRIHDFFSNIGELITFANLVLQGRPGPAAETAFRFGVNSTLGMFGFVDLASAAGMPRHDEDFGQTLGCWGVGTGPYLFLPIVGPSNVRDAAGLAVDRFTFAYVDPFGASSYDDADLSVRIGIGVVNAVDTRANIPFRYFSTGSPFEYEYIRLLYTKKRRADLSK